MLLGLHHQTIGRFGVHYQTIRDFWVHYQTIRDFWVHHQTIRYFGVRPLWKKTKEQYNGIFVLSTFIHYSGINKERFLLSVHHTFPFKHNSG